MGGQGGIGSGSGSTTSGRRTALHIALLALLPAISVGALDADSAAGSPSLSGLVVVAVEEHGVAAAAGLLPGDLLISWHRPGQEEQGEPLTGADRWLWLVEMESPAGPVRLAGERGEASLLVDLEPGRWGLTVRPGLAGEDATTAGALAALARNPPGRQVVEDEAVARRVDELIGKAERETDSAFWWWLHLRRGEVDFAAGRVEEAGQHWARAAEVAAENSLAWPRLLALDRLADALQAQGRRDEAEAVLRELIVFAEQSWGEALPLAWALVSLAFRLAEREQLDEAIGLLERALELRQRLAPGSLPVALTLDRLGMLERRQGRPATAMDFHLQALELRQELDPHGPATAITHNSLGLAAWRLGDLDAAARWLEEAREHLLAADPDSPILISAVSNLGMVARERGELLTAQGHLLESLALEEGRGPLRSDRSLAIILNSLGMVAADRGDLTASRDYYARSLALFEGIAPGSRATILVAENLGLIAVQQGELDDAEGYLRHALETKEAQVPDSMDLAFTYNNLGKLYYARRETKEAEEYFRRSLAIKERLAPKAMSTANTLGSLGHLARERGDLDAARSFYLRALEIRRQHGAEGIFASTALADLGALAAEQGDLEEAAELLTAAEEIVTHLAPGSVYQAKILRSVGELHRARGDLAASAEVFQQALEALEAQVGKLPGGEGTRARYRAGHLGYYRDAIEVFLELGRGAEAYQVLERSRARMLVDMLAERDLLFSADIPQELAEAQHHNRREIDRLQERLAALDPGAEPEEVPRLQRELARTLRQRDELAETVRRTSPRLGALRYPRPLGPADVQALLEPGTLLLAFSVSRSGTDVFALTREDLRVVRLPVGEEELRHEIEHFRRLIQRGGLERSSPEALIAQGERLWTLLLTQFTAELSSSQRLLVSPDGPLHLLPFAALVQPSTPGSGGAPEPVFLAASHAVAVVLSASLLQELRHERRRREPGSGSARVVAFGDPVGPGLGGHGETLQHHRGLVPRHALTPLPGARAEVEALASRFGPAAHTFLGPQATEARARSESRGARYLHFATHGLLNELFPLGSGLVLGAGEGHNGLLQAWEIFEDLRIDSDLVTLSACETALGAEVRGEGLVSLTRAFQYAGARGVVASLWRVADLSTSNLMDHFYEGLEEGRATAHALAEAQRRMIAREATAHPYHWAGFVLHGDWR